MNRDTPDTLDTSAFARGQLAIWFETSARQFPWRSDSDPYHVLIAEMMLRRTQARQVVPVFHTFLARYPDIESLDQAPADEVSHVLYPLGLSWRADNFKILAHEIMTRYKGSIPESSELLLSLTGVGPYVAAAVRSFVFNQPAVIMDTNTVRVAGRYYGFPYTPESRRRKDVIEAVSNLLDPQEPARSNYALLDFAALVCRAKDPLHAHCPLASQCCYYQAMQNKQVEIDVSKKNV